MSVNSSAWVMSAVLLGGAAIVIATVVFAIAGCATTPAEAPSPTQPSSDSQPTSSASGGVAVFDANTGQILTLPPDEAADAIRTYWTPERMSQARPN